MTTLLDLAESMKTNPAVELDDEMSDALEDLIQAAETARLNDVRPTLEDLCNPLLRAVWTEAAYRRRAADLIALSQVLTHGHAGALATLDDGDELLRQHTHAVVDLVAREELRRAGS